MPAYTSVAKVIETLPTIGSVTNITSSVITAFITDAEALVNAKLARTFTVPVSGTPPLLAAVATDVALYRMVTRRLVVGEKTNRSEWPNRYKEAMDILDALVAGNMQLVTSSGDTIAQMNDADTAWSNTQNLTPTFNEDDMVNSYVDERKLD